jgi:transaldolase/glucose-6-phosphate isomerase
VLYVDELIGSDTVNTLPVATLDAFRDHGTVAETLTRNVDAARRVLDDLAKAGISLDAVTGQLERDGVKLFADAADSLFGAVARKRVRVLDTALSRQALRLPSDLAERVNHAGETWRSGGHIRQLWAHDASLWTGADEGQWLGWLDSAAQALAAIETYERFAADIHRAGFSHILLLGMGGSSLGPEVLARSFAPRTGWPQLLTLDSTDPMQIAAAAASVDLEKTLFIVSSKSGSTVEPNMLLAYFFAAVETRLGRAAAGQHFVAVTDPGSQLEALARRDGFRQVFHGEPTIGGRYSVLSPFGLVPAAAAGFDIAGLLREALTMVRSCGADVPPADNPGVALGLVLGEAGLAGRDKVTILAPPALASVGAWVEQLIAESTGKTGKALIPVDGEALAAAAAYDDDRVFINLRLGGQSGASDAMLDALAAAGHPVVDLALERPEQVAQEFFRFEMATAVAGAVLGINPFDQPDVEASKVKTRELTAAFERTGSLPPETPVLEDGAMAIYADATTAAALRQTGAGSSAASWLKAHFAQVRPGDYVALLAYLAQNDGHAAALQAARTRLRDRYRVATCVGFGPRFLHSTGQAYKGGPNTGVFLQITADDPADLTIPGKTISFGSIKAAQARGDAAVLIERGRRMLRVHLKGAADANPANSRLADLGAAIDAALS